jgi:hypothetical protein
LNGESSVHIDRGRWLYRFALDDDSITIYRARRSGQSLASPEAWRCLAVLGVSDAFVVPVPDGWQPFIELGEGRQRWALERRGSIEEAESATRHFLASLADSIAYASQSRGALGEKEPDDRILHAAQPPVPPAEEPAVEALLAQACTTRASVGWELVYSRQRAAR